MKPTLQFFLALFIFISTTARSTKVETVSHNDWYNPASWMNNKIPVNPDTIVIRHYITFSRDVFIMAPTVLIIEKDGTLCGDFFLDVTCGARFINHGNLFINSGRISDGANHQRFYAKVFVDLVACEQAGFGLGFLNVAPQGQAAIWPPTLCKTEATNWGGEINTSIQKLSIQNELSVSPNPILYGILKIGGPGVLQVSLFDHSGRLIYSGEGNRELFINMEDYPRGVYLALIKNESDLIHRKILKE